jgi:hypothetical protein
MIAYCPLEELEPPVRPKSPEPVKKLDDASGFGIEDTELNYVVMAFIVGVIVLAVSDTIRA